MTPGTSTPRRREALPFLGGRPLATPATLSAVQRTAGNSAAQQVVARSAHSGSAPPVQRAGDESATGPASKPNTNATAAFRKEFTEFIYGKDSLSFDEAYWAFVDNQVIYTSDVTGNATFQEKVKTLVWQKAQDKVNDYRKEAQPMNIPDGEPVRLYRKMSAREAEIFLKAKSPKAGITKSMEYGDKQYRKYLTTSLVHTASFNNEDSADRDNEAVLEFRIPAKDYWAFFAKYAKPNQLTGVFNQADSAVVNQEGHRVGDQVNFRKQEQVDEVLLKKTHHNVGIGGGNVAEFARMTTAIEEIDKSRLDQAVADSKAAMTASLISGLNSS